jgi:NADH-quinone oxidoreductase subunit M
MTVDGMSGAVAQMIAHGYVIVGLFFAAEIINRRFNTWKIKEMGGIRLQAPIFASLFLIMVLASVAMPGTYNFVGEFTVLFSMFQVNIWFAIFGGLTIILGAYYMLKMFQNVMLGETKMEFADINFTEIAVLVVIATFLLGYGIYPKPITELVQPAIENIVAITNR